MRNYFEGGWDCWRDCRGLKQKIKTLDSQSHGTEKLVLAWNLETWKWLETKLEPGTDTATHKTWNWLQIGAIDRPGSRNRLHSTKWKAWQTKTNPENNSFTWNFSGIEKEKKKYLIRCFCLAMPPRKQHTKLCNEPVYQSTTWVSLCKGNHHYLLYKTWLRSKSL